MITNEPLTNKRKNEIKAASIRRQAQWQSEGHNRLAGLVNDFVHMINDAETMYELGLATQWFDREVG